MASTELKSEQLAKIPQIRISAQSSCINTRSSSYSSTAEWLDKNEGNQDRNGDRHNSVGGTRAFHQLAAFSRHDGEKRERQQTYLSDSDGLTTARPSAALTTDTAGVKTPSESVRPEPKSACVAILVQNQRVSLHLHLILFIDQQSRYTYPCTKDGFDPGMREQERPAICHDRRTRCGGHIRERTTASVLSLVIVVCCGSGK